MAAITIPATLDEALATLSGIGRLLTAKKWERAAILAAYVEVKVGPPIAGKAAITATEFAKFGIVGLTDPETVARYVNAWMAEVGVRPAAGETVQLPTVEFPPTPPVYSVPVEVWETVIEEAGLTPTHEYDPQAEYAKNEKPADKESDLERAAAASRQLILQLPLAEAKVFATEAEFLMAKWETQAMRDVVRRAVHEAAVREGLATV